MLRTAAAFAALGLTAGLYLTTGAAMAEPLHHERQVAASGSAALWRPSVEGKTDAEVRTTYGKPDGDSLVNNRNGKVITLEMVQNDARWQAETAEMLRRDRTSEVIR